MKYDFSDNIQRGILFLSKYSKDFYLQIASLVKPKYFEFPVHANFFRPLVATMITTGISPRIYIY